MANPQTKAAGTAAAPAKTEYPRAFGDHMHLAVITRYLGRALPLLKQHDENEHRDELFELDRLAAERFIEQCRRAVPDPDAPTPATPQD